MPELPEVEATRRRIAARALEREVARVTAPDAEALHGPSPAALGRAVTGRAFGAVRRHGKVLFARAGDGPWLVVHFGMTGDLALLAPGETLPEHARVVFDFADGGRLAFDNPRRLGWLELTGDVGTYLAQAGLGPDALALDGAGVARIVGGTRGQVKPALMDQSKLAGIGNVYSDEILFRAGIRPDAIGAELDAAALAALHAALHDVLETASARRARGEALPDDWLAGHREAGGRCPRCGGALARERIGGRSARFCPRCQGDGGGDG